MKRDRQSRKEQTILATAIAAAVIGASALSVHALVARIPVPQQPQPTLPVSAPAGRGPAVDEGNTGRPEDPAMPGGIMDQAAQLGMQVYVDDSFASVDKLRTAIRLQRNSQSREAIDAYQKIVDEFGQKLVYLNDKSYVSITDYVRDRLLEMPAVKTGMYDQLFGADARKAVESAIDDRDVSRLLRVSDRYYPSTAALKGFSHAAEWYFERGEFSAAAETWRKLLKHPLAGAMQADLLFRAAAAQSLAGSPSTAGTLRGRLAKDFGEATGVVSGKEVKLLPRLDEILAMPSWEKLELGGDEWPAFGGGPSRSVLMKTNASIGARLWSVELNTAIQGSPISASAVNEQRQLEILVLRSGSSVSVATGDPTMLPSHPVLSNGSLFIHAGSQLLAVSANAGAKLWSYPAAPSGSGATVVRSSSNMRSMGHDSVSAYGDQIFAMLPVSPSNPLQYDNTGLPQFPTRIVCINREDGRELWSRPASEVKTEKEGQITFIGSPIVTRQGVYTMARKSANNNFSQQYLVRLDRDTGQPTWTCYLCSTSLVNTEPGMRGSTMMGNNVPVPTLVDDVVYVTTGQGADCAVDANVGRILWLRISARPKTTTATQYTPSWRFNPPLIVGDKLLTAEVGRGLRVYNRTNGKLLREYAANDLLDPTRGGSGTSIDVLAGAIGSKVVLSIGYASACFDESELDKDMPAPEWRGIVAGAGKPFGRPFLSETGYYVPFESKLVRFDVKSGLSEQWEWPQTDQAQPGKPGNLLVTSEQVIVVNDGEIAGYSKWETARDNRLAKIAANPSDPLPYMSLAEVSFRTNHHDLAQANMKKSVELANGGAAPAGQSVGDMLDRLYRTNLAFAEQLLIKNDNEMRDLSRFYFEQCRASARKPEQQAEWRMRLAELSQKQKKFDEAVTLYSEILADPAVRLAAYRESDVMQSAGATAEQRIRPLKEKDVAYYKRYEDQAGVLTQRGVSQQDVVVLQQVIDAYPNSAASIDAAKALSTLYIDKSEWESSRRVLFWLQPRVKDEAHARVLADLAKVNVGLKKIPTAAAWAARGLRLYKDYSWTDAGKKMTFGDLKALIGSTAGGDLEGRLPKWSGDIARPALDFIPSKEQPNTVALGDMKPLEEGAQLLTPIETSTAFRSPNLLFYRKGNFLRVYDTAKEAFALEPILLPRTADTVLLGVTKDRAILMQNDVLIGVDLRSRATWTKDLPNANIARPPAVARGGRILTVPMGTQVDVIDGIIYINGTAQATADSVTVVDENGNPRIGRGGADPESVRRAAFAPLGPNLRFTSVRMINGKVYLLAGSQLEAYNVADGSPAWVSREDRKLAVTLPTGISVGLLGNEDLIVAQIDSADGKSSTFCAFDAETGKAGRTIKLDTERANWRGLGDDGTLFVVSAQSVTAWDMLSEQGGVMWRKTGIGSKFNAATALTLDGLVVIDDAYDVMCLALESGEKRWSSTLPMNDNLLKTGASAISSMRSYCEGDLIVFQTTDGCAAYQSQPQIDPTKQLAWSIQKVDQLPQRQSLQFFDRYVIEQMSGAVSGVATRRVVLGAREFRGGKMSFNLALSERDAPTLRNWQVVDNGIAVDVGTPSTGNNTLGRIYYLKNKPPQPPKPVEP